MNEINTAPLQGLALAAATTLASVPHETNTAPLQGLVLAAATTLASVPHETIEDAHDERRKRNDDSATRQALIEAGLVKPKGNR